MLSEEADTGTLDRRQEVKEMLAASSHITKILASVSEQLPDRSSRGGHGEVFKQLSNICRAGRNFLDQDNLQPSMPATLLPRHP